MPPCHQTEDVEDGKIKDDKTTAKVQSNEFEVFIRATILFIPFYAFEILLSSLAFSIEKIEIVSCRSCCSCFYSCSCCCHFQFRSFVGFSNVVIILFARLFYRMMLCCMSEWQRMVKLFSILCAASLLFSSFLLHLNI